MRNDRRGGGWIKAPEVLETSVAINNEYIEGIVENGVDFDAKGDDDR